MFDIVKRYYEKGIYNADDVYKFVRAGKITSDEYYAIVGF